MGYNTQKKLDKLYNQFVESLDLNDPDHTKMYQLATVVDKKFDSKLKVLFLISLYCNVFYKIYGTKTGQLGENLNYSPNISCKNFRVFTYKDPHTVRLLQNLVTYFNTDANYLIPITGLILQDLNNMRIELLIK